MPFFWHQTCSVQTNNIFIFDQPNSYYTNGATRIDIFRIQETFIQNDRI